MSSTEVKRALFAAETQMITVEQRSPSSLGSLVRHSDQKDITIYVLECQDDCFYIGKTHLSVQDRFEQHKCGQGAAFTRLHPPIHIHKSFAGDKWDEDACTLRFMELYGIENVRGGSYVQCKLSEELKQDIARRFTAARDHCFVCDNIGHFARDCPRSIDSGAMKGESGKGTPESKAQVSSHGSITGTGTLQSVVGLLSGLLISPSTAKMQTPTESGASVSTVPAARTSNTCCVAAPGTSPSKASMVMLSRSPQQQRHILRFRDQRHVCWRCGRKGHYSPDCSEVLDIEGQSLS
jgi:hypothetical protein